MLRMRSTGRRLPQDRECSDTDQRDEHDERSGLAPSTVGA
jgi:hypothetical protein